VFTPYVFESFTLSRVAIMNLPSNVALTISFWRLFHRYIKYPLIDVTIQNVLIGCLCKTVLDCRPTTIKLLDIQKQF